MKYPVSIVVKTSFDPKEMETALEVMNHQLSQQFKLYGEISQHDFKILFGKKKNSFPVCSNEQSQVEIHIIQNTRDKEEVYFDDDADLTGYICNAAVFSIESTVPVEKNIIISSVNWYKVSDHIDSSLVFDGYVYKYPDKGENNERV